MGLAENKRNTTYRQTYVYGLKCILHTFQLVCFLALFDPAHLHLFARLVVIVPTDLNGNVSCVYHRHTDTHCCFADVFIHVCMHCVKGNFTILQWKCLFFQIASQCWCRQSQVPTVWLSYWVTYFPSGQHAVAIREYLFFPQSVDAKLGSKLCFVWLLLTDETWNLLQIDEKWCTVALKAHLII